MDNEISCGITSIKRTAEKSYALKTTVFTGILCDYAHPNRITIPVEYDWLLMG